jgi:hypothetical protein
VKDHFQEKSQQYVLGADVPVLEIAGFPLG